MVVKSVKAKKDYYAEPEKKKVKYLIMYHPRFRWGYRDGVYWEAHGFKFEEGVVYSVSEEVFEWSKGQRHFFRIKRFEDIEVVFK